PDMSVLGNTLVIVNNDLFPEEADGTDFGIRKPGENQTNTFEIENVGLDVLTVNSVKLTGPDDDYFSINAPTPGTMIQPGNKISFTVEFMPSGRGVYTNTVLIESDDFDEQIFSYTITGRSILTEILVEGDETEIP